MDSALAVVVNPNVADLHRVKTRQSAADVAARRLGQDEAYLIVRELLSEASTAADGMLWRERSVFGRWEVYNIRVNPDVEGEVFRTQIRN